MLEKVTEHDQIVDKYTNVTANASLNPWDYVVRFVANAGTGNYTITLPAVSECTGRFYSIVARTIADARVVTITHKGDSEAWTNFTLTVTGKKAILYSDGLAWHKIIEA